MLNKLICLFKGHKRGKRVDGETFQCPRCKATWVRKVKHAAA